MTTEPAALPPEQFNEIVRVVRETIRAEIRDEFAARAEVKQQHSAQSAELARLWDRFNQGLMDYDDYKRVAEGVLGRKPIPRAAMAWGVALNARLDGLGGVQPGAVDARTALQRSQDYEVPAVIDGYPI